MKWREERRIDACINRLNAALVLQKHAKIFLAKNQMRCKKRWKRAVLIQALVRGHLGRKRAHKRKQLVTMRDVLCPRLQCFQTMQRMRKRRWFVAARNIQRLVRGFLGRCRFRNYRRNLMATRIQRCFRYWRSRGRLLPQFFFGMSILPEKDPVLES